MSAGRSCLIEVRGLTKHFGGLVAVKNVDLDLAAGEIVGLIGPNGSGKSTTMRLIMGLERPTAGSIRVAGTDVAGWAAHRIARMGLGLVFQHSRPLHRQTVLENITLALLPDSLLQFRADRAVAERAHAIARRVGLSEVTDRLPATLPFADLRKLELAKAIARDPRIVLVDEPFAGLTRAETEAFSEIIRGFRNEGRAVLLVDHNVRSVAALVDRAVAMYLGERIAEGTPEDVIADATVRRVYLGGGIESVARRAPASATQPPLLAVNTVRVLYGKALALDDVSIEVRPGAFVSVVGLNGAGKTTLFNAISGLLPYTGDILWAGTPLRGRSAARIARDGLVHCPETRELFGDMSVRENLDLGGQHLARHELAERLAWVCDLFPILQDRQRQTAATLSGGEQQMLAIARALMTRPRLLIMDEPTLGLAPVILELLAKALDRLRQTTDITILLGEQNVTFALPHADHVYVLDHARVTWEGDPARFADEVGARYL